jgi:hypothetical protein
MSEFISIIIDLDLGGVKLNDLPIIGAQNTKDLSKFTKNISFWKFVIFSVAKILFLTRW